jgi:hypothetical protein
MLFYCPNGRMARLVMRYPHKIKYIGANPISSTFLIQTFTMDKPQGTGLGVHALKYYINRMANYYVQ